jgi:tetratricopeptide (TPR) repeat protein
MPACESPEYEKALIVCERMLAFEMDQLQRSNINRKIGDCCLEILKRKNDRKICERAVAAYEEALSVYIEERYPAPRARVLRGLGSARSFLADYVNRSQNLAQAIACWEGALRYFQRASAPLDHAGIQNELGGAYRKLAELEDRKENGKKALDACQIAIGIFNQKDCPMQFAAAKSNLASVFLTLAQDAKDESVQAEGSKMAIRAYEEAIMIYTSSRLPQQYAAMKNNLAIAYLTLSEVEERANNCRMALDACEEALSYRKLEDQPMAYAALQNNLGNAYLALAEEEVAKDDGQVDGKGEQNLRCQEYCQLAIEAYCNALMVYTKEDFPRLHATAKTNLANIYLARAQMDDAAANSMKAIKAASEALAFFTLDTSPADYADAQGSLWLAHLILADIEFRAENCSAALEAAEERLKAVRKFGKPFSYASCSKDLAITATMLADLELSSDAKLQDCEKAISAALEALRIYRVQSNPQEYAETQILLWAAYSALSELENRAENCKSAIVACQAAIRVYDKISLEEHADALKNLAYSFITLAEMENRAENCENAIDACKSALQYYTIERAPIMHADILRDLAYAYVTLSEVSEREECCKKALKAYRKAHKIYETHELELERLGDPGARDMREMADRCHRSMQSCKAMFKAGRKAGADHPDNNGKGSGA